MGRMQLPVMPPIAPMLAKLVSALPDSPVSFEPKWDGFRSIIFRDGDEVEIGSRNGKPMTRYFPELVEALKQTCRPAACSTARSSWWGPTETGSISTHFSSASTCGQPGEAVGRTDAGELCGI
ncbi:DNA ligase [Arthrobacter sp. Hiyo6]|nr:DNA ligase [Arthrobacter sp. Hiyo6]